MTEVNEQKPLFNVWRKSKIDGKWHRIPDEEVAKMFGGGPPAEFTDPTYQKFYRI